MSGEKSKFHQDVERWVNGGYGIRSCDSHCPDNGTEHAHLSDDGLDFIAYPDGTVSGIDLTPPAAMVPRYDPIRYR